MCVRVCVFSYSVRQGRWERLPEQYWHPEAWLWWGPSSPAASLCGQSSADVYTPPTCSSDALQWCNRTMSVLPLCKTKAVFKQAPVALTLLQWKGTFFLLWLLQSYNTVVSKRKQESQPSITFIPFRLKKKKKEETHVNTAGKTRSHFPFWSLLTTVNTTFFASFSEWIHFTPRTRWKLFLCQSREICI